MGLLQDWIRKLKENQKETSMEDLYDERPRDRELLILRRQNREMNEEEEKEYLKELLRQRHREKTRQNLYSINEGENPRQEMIRKLKGKKLRNQNNCYFRKVRI